MAGGYSQTFTLAEIFNNKELKNLLPLVNYKETKDEVGKTHRTTRMKSISGLIYEKSIIAARPFYKNFVHRKTGNYISLSGTLIADHDAAVEAVYQRILATKAILEMTANNADIIRSALKEGEKDHNAPKLYLRQKTIAQIKGLDKKGAEKFMQDVMENIFYGNYPKTQQKFGVLNKYSRNPFSYEKNKTIWEIKVGAYAD